MKNFSLWLDIDFDKPKVLDKNINVDILIIGAGMTGLSTAYQLRNSNLNICVVEKNLIAHGVSSKTTGKLTYLQDNIYSKLKDKAKLYYKSQKDAIEIVKNIVEENNIDCNLEKVASYIYTEKDNDKKLIKEKEKLQDLNISFQEHNNIPINSNCKYAISVNDTYVFHPLKYLKKLKEIIEKNKIPVYENSSVSEIRKKDNIYECIVNKKIVKAKKVIIATHYPFFLYPMLTPLKTYLEKSYISASKVKEIKHFSAISLSKQIKSIRFHKDNYFIYLTGTHNLCNKYNYKDNFNNLLLDLEKMNIEPVYIWSNHDIMTEDHLPYIGFIDDNLLIGTGYNTWGMTNGTIASKILKDLVLEEENEYINLFDPKRNKSKNSLKYPLYMSYSAKSFIENKLVKNKFWYNDNIIFEKRNGKNIAIYLDKENNKHIVYNLCPHMKCSLIFNEVEKTWDCPCHGSRFDIDGKCIIGPSKKDITYKE